MRALRPISRELLAMLIVLSVALAACTNPGEATVESTATNAGTAPEPAGSRADPPPRRRAASIQDGVQLFTHMAPDGTDITVSEGEVTFWGTCNCWVTRRGVLVSYVAKGQTGVTPALGSIDTKDVKIVQSWTLDASFVAARVGDRVKNVRMLLTDGRVDELTPVGNWALFATTVGFARMEAFDAGGALVASCFPSENAPGC